MVTFDGSCNLCSCTRWRSLRGAAPHYSQHHVKAPHGKLIAYFLVPHGSNEYLLSKHSSLLLHPIFPQLTFEAAPLLLPPPPEH